jgi:hypothetical protein
VGQAQEAEVKTVVLPDLDGPLWRAVAEETVLFGALVTEKDLDVVNSLPFKVLCKRLELLGT